MTKKKIPVNNKKEIRQPVSFSISRIELIESSINVPEKFEFKVGEKFTFKLSVDFTSDKQLSLLTVKISYFFYMHDDIVFSMVVNNEYCINNIAKYIVDKKFSDRIFIKYIADLSLNHARGIQATIIKDTPLSKLFIPVVQLDRIENEIIVDPE